MFGVYHTQGFALGYAVPALRAEERPMPPRYKLRIAVVTVLALAPVVFLCGVGMYHLWDRGWSFVAYWPMAACWLAAYLLGRYWTRRRPPAEEPSLPPPGYWTDRDKRAWQIVEAHAAAIPVLSAEQFGDLNRYAADAQELALKVARVYKPDAADPFGHLTLPEILACGELVAHDLTGLVTRYVPASHLLTVTDLKRIRDAVDTASDWYPRLRNVYWLASAIFNPVKTGMQAVATKAGLAPAFAAFQQNMLLWFYTAYVKELGRYLIELNSGRLKVGAKRYLELMALHMTPPTEAAPTDKASGGRQPPDDKASGGRQPPDDKASGGGGPPRAGGGLPPPALGPHRGAPPPRSPEAPPVTLAIVGPVKAGKSSLVNALLGEQQAATDVLPLTPGVTRYTLRQPGQPTFTLLDTAGFGNDGASEADVQAAVEAARLADVLLLMVPARSAARRPESEFLDRVRAALAALPNLKMPPVLLVLSHIDLLSPVMEWAPPYDWRTGTRPKEVQIREATQAAKESFAGRIADAVPVCTAAGKELGVKDDLLPAVAAFLGEARGVGLLRALHAEASADKVKRLVGQIGHAAGQLLRAWWETTKK
jgi:predicted GTPase